MGIQNKIRKRRTAREQYDYLQRRICDYNSKIRACEKEKVKLFEKNGLEILEAFVGKTYSYKNILSADKTIFETWYVSSIDNKTKEITVDIIAGNNCYTSFNLNCVDWYAHLPYLKEISKKTFKKVYDDFIKHLESIKP